LDLPNSRYVAYVLRECLGSLDPPTAASTARLLAMIFHE
jgi:hypothetical protein